MLRVRALARLPRSGTSRRMQATDRDRLTERLLDLPFLGNRARAVRWSRRRWILETISQFRRRSPTGLAPGTAFLARFPGCGADPGAGWGDFRLFGPILDSNGGLDCRIGIESPPGNRDSLSISQRGLRCH